MKYKINCADQPISHVVFNTILSTHSEFFLLCPQKKLKIKKKTFCCLLFKIMYVKNVLETHIYIFHYSVSTVQETTTRKFKPCF